MKGCFWLFKRFSCLFSATEKWQIDKETQANTARTLQRLCLSENLKQRTLGKQAALDSGARDLIKPSLGRTITLALKTRLKPISFSWVCCSNIPLPPWSRSYQTLHAYLQLKKKICFDTQESLSLIRISHNVLICTKHVLWEEDTENNLKGKKCHIILILTIY